MSSKYRDQTTATLNGDAPENGETVVDGEDFWVASRTEPGIRTGLLDRVVFGRNEPAPQHLHLGFRSALSRRPRRAPH